MKCLSCGKVYDQGKCPVCGLQSVIAIGDMDDMQKKQFEVFAEKWRENFVGNIELSIVAYEWQANANEILELAEKHYLPFPKFVDMKLGETYWINEQFARNDGNSLNLTLSAKKDSATKEVAVTIPAPKTEDFWHIGVSIEEGFSAKLHLKAGNEETVSQFVDIL